MISLIAAVGKNRELGLNGDLCFHLKSDLKYFKDVTMGHKVIMGRKTYESLPGGALPGRENYVMTRSSVDYPNVTEIHSMDDAAIMGASEEVFIIGGASIYEQFIGVADKIYLTEIDASAEADAYFPEFDKSMFKREVVSSGSENGINFDFVVYTKERL
ncbi:MAG: dihydrofolate reductase [Candidatus Saccharibacteria bacterium]|nr:dihydrofolate reductase [Candidatus Saccharibacteria bacterium]